MSLRRWRKTIADAGKTVSSKVSGAVDSVKETANEMLDTSLNNIEKAEKELKTDLNKKGLRVFEEIGLPQGVTDAYKTTIVNFALEELKDAWENPERKTK